MPRSSLRQGPLDHLGLAARDALHDGSVGVRLAEQPTRRVVELRARPTAAFRDAAASLFGISLPAASPETTVGDGIIVLWMGPDRWWFIDTGALPQDAEIHRALDAFTAAVVEIGDSLAVISLSGPHARDVLAKGCTLDLHPRAFRGGQIAQTLLAKAQITLNQTADSEYEIYVRRSFAEYLWTWLEDAALEYGVAVQGA